MSDPFDSFRHGDPDLQGRYHKTMPDWSHFALRIAWTIGGLLLLLTVFGVVVAIV